MWWDERFAAFEGAVTEVDEQSRTAAGTQLSATIALESAYVRFDLVLLGILIEHCSRL